MKQFVLAMAIALWAFACAESATYFVSPTGSNANPGNEALPFLTLNYAVTQLQPGDTLYVRAGTYPESLINQIPSGTSWEAPVTIAAYPGETVILQPPSGHHVVELHGLTKNYIVLKNLKLDGALVRSHVVRIGYTPRQPNSTAHHIRLDGVEVMNGKSQGILVTAKSHHCEFIDLNVHHNGSDKRDHGLYLQGSFHVVYRGSYAYNKSYGIHAYGAGSDNTFIGARIHHNRIGVQSTHDRNRWINNLVYANTTGGIITNNGDDAKYLHNTVVFNGRWGININYRYVARAQLINNIVYGNTWGIRDVGRDTVKSNNLLTDAGFADPTNHDYRLTRGSSAIDAGMPLPEVTTDYLRAPRPDGNGWDIGAYEHPRPAAPVAR
jgi:Right handed beta helix region